MRGRVVVFDSTSVDYSYDYFILVYMDFPHVKLYIFLFTDCQTPFEGDGFLPHRGRGHQRNHYRGRNRFNFKRNGRGRRRNPDQFHQINPSFDPQHQN